MHRGPMGGERSYIAKEEIMCVFRGCIGCGWEVGVHISHRSKLSYDFLSNHPHSSLTIYLNIQTKKGKVAHILYFKHVFHSLIEQPLLTLRAAYTRIV